MVQIQRIDRCKICFFCLKIHLTKDKKLIISKLVLNSILIILEFSLSIQLCGATYKNINTFLMFKDF